MILVIIIFSFCNVISVNVYGDKQIDYGKSSIIDMLINHDCPKIHNPKNINGNLVVGKSTVVCQTDDIKIRWMW